MSLAAAKNAKMTPESLALADERHEITWARLDSILNRATIALLREALTEVDRIGVFATNSVETVLAHQVALHAGVSSVPINFHLTGEEVAYILADSGTKILFVSPETAVVGVEAARLAGVRKVIAWRCDPSLAVVQWDEWVASAPDVEPPTHMIPRPHLHYTSGTTGRPKGTDTPPSMFRRAASVADFFAGLRETFEANGSRSPVAVVSPMYHTGPLSSIRGLGGGAAVVVLSRFDATNLLAAIERYRVQSSVMVPTHFQRLLALPATTRMRYDVSSLLNVSHTGAACPREVKKQMIDWWGPVLTEAYGATEAGTTNMITSEEWLRHPGSVGRTVPQFEPVVVDDDGKELGAYQTGRLFFRDKTGRGIVYHNDAEKTRAAHLAPGVFTLGDVGYYDDEGFVFITDRLSDMIVSGGTNIYPAEIEQVLTSHPDVGDVAVIGVPSAEMGEEVKALVVPKVASAPPTPEALDRFCRERLAGYKRPRSYEFLADIGRNALGKINKRELKRPYWPTDRMIGG